jgi:polyisoprenyl-teichoic acid--peptidoglycan teichoic acid transferase
MSPATRLRARTWPQRLLIVVGCLVVVVCVGTASVAAYLSIRFGQITRVGDIDLSTRTGEAANYLLVGTDSREGLDPADPDAGGFLGDTGCECTDTIMVLRIDPAAQQAYILSFPRDLFLPISGTGDTARINTAHAHGAQTLIDTIQDNFNVPIHHYVEVDFVGFERLVDAVGGVPVWFDAPVRDRHTGLDVPQAECVVLDGEQARKFVRSRYLEYQDPDGDWHTDQTADLGRITRQQVFVRRAVAKAVSEGLSNPITLNELVSAGVANVSLDEHLDAGDMLAIGEAFADYDSDDLVGYSIPSEPMQTSAGAKVELPLMRKAQTMLNVFRGLPPGTIAPESIDVTVLNGTDVPGQAADVGGALGEIGFNVVDVASYPGEDMARTTVLYGSYAGGFAERVAAHITGGAALVQDNTLDPEEVVVVTGSDLTTIHDQPAPEGSPDDRRTTTTTPAPSSTAPGETTTTSAPPTTTTTVIGYSTGEPPDGVDCG